MRQPIPGDVRPSIRRVIKFLCICGALLLADPGSAQTLSGTLGDFHQHNSPANGGRAYMGDTFYNAWLPGTDLVYVVGDDHHVRLAATNQRTDLSDVDGRFAMRTNNGTSGVEGRNASVFVLQGSSGAWTPTSLAPRLLPGWFTPVYSESSPRNNSLEFLGPATGESQDWGGRPWKAQGIAAVDGRLFLNISPVGGDGARFGLASSPKSFLLMSEDQGGTWIFRDGDRWLWDVAPTPVTATMFPNEKFAKVAFIDYLPGQAYGDDGYVYAMSNDGNWDNGSDLYLARVHRSRIANLDPADWVYYSGGGTWTSNPDNAVSILHKDKKLSEPAVYKLPSGKFVLLEWYYPRDPGIRPGDPLYYGAIPSYDCGSPCALLDAPRHTVWEFYEADNPSGPWTLFYQEDFPTDGWYNPVVAGKLSSGNTLWLLAAGNYLDLQWNGSWYDYTPTARYQLHSVPFTVSPRSNLLTNAMFADDLSQWNAVRMAYERGGYAGQTVPGEAYVWQSLAWLPNGAHTASARYKATGSGHLDIKTQCGADTVEEEYAPAIADDRWHTISTAFTMPSGRSSCTFLLWSDPGLMMSWDDASLN